MKFSDCRIKFWLVYIGSELDIEVALDESLFEALPDNGLLKTLKQFDFINAIKDSNL